MSLDGYCGPVIDPIVNIGSRQSNGSQHPNFDLSATVDRLILERYIISSRFAIASRQCDDSRERGLRNLDAPTSQVPYQPNKPMAGVLPTYRSQNGH